MKSKNRKWQDRWGVDTQRGIATHDLGLRVRLENGIGIAENGDEIVQALIPVHGAHNAPAMVQRLVREGAQMLIDPTARGWRN